MVQVRGEAVGRNARWWLAAPAALLAGWVLTTGEPAHAEDTPVPTVPPAVTTLTIPAPNTGLGGLDLDELDPQALVDSLGLDPGGLVGGLVPAAPPGSTAAASTTTVATTSTTVAAADPGAGTSSVDTAPEEVEPTTGGADVEPGRAPDAAPVAATRPARLLDLQRAVSTSAEDFRVPGVLVLAGLAFLLLHRRAMPVDAALREATVDREKRRFT